MEFFHKFMSDFSLIGLAQIGTILAITVLDAALSGDNSIAINALVLDLPKEKQSKAVWLGMVVAALMRLVALTFASFIIRNPWVQIIGGLYLIKLCVDHFRKDDGDDEHRAPKNFILVLMSIGWLDLSLSTDNIVAVVAMSSNFAVIVIGVMLSIAMLAVATQLVRKVMGRFPSLESGAYVILAYLGLLMLIEHGSEFVLWLGEKSAIAAKAIHESQDFISGMSFSVGDLGEIAGVGAIVAACILVDVRRRRKEKEGGSAAPAETASASMAAAK